MTNYNDGKWHGWNCGECPVHPDTVVDAVFEHGTPVTNEARKLRWGKDTSGLDVDIVAFRVVKEHKEPREFWVDIDRCIAVPSFHAGFIHVREVIDND